MIQTDKKMIIPKDRKTIIKKDNKTIIQKDTFRQKDDNTERYRQTKRR